MRPGRGPTPRCWAACSQRDRRLGRSLARRRGAAAPDPRRADSPPPSPAPHGAVTSSRSRTCGRECPGVVMCRARLRCESRRPPPGGNHSVMSRVPPTLASDMSQVLLPRGRLASWDILLWSATRNRGSRGMLGNSHPAGGKRCARRSCGRRPRRGRGLESLRTIRSCETWDRERIKKSVYASLRRRNPP